MKDFGRGIEHVRVIDVAEVSSQKTKLAKGQNKLQAYIITPTRELAVKIEKHKKFGFI